MGDDSWLRSAIGKSTPDTITVRGRNLATELMGKLTFSELAFFLTAARMPSPGETRLFDAALVALADHGLTPSVLAARLTWTGATESLQGAVAAGLLGAGNVFLGVVEDTARFLAAIRAEAAGSTAPGSERDGDVEAKGGDDELRAAAQRAMEAEIAAGRRMHPRPRPSRPQGRRSPNPPPLRHR
jgi:citrate synthase